MKNINNFSTYSMRLAAEQVFNIEYPGMSNLTPELKEAITQAEKIGASYHVGNVLSSDVFYNDSASANEGWQKMGVLCVEMEAAALYMNAARCGKNALAMFTVSDSLVTGEATTAEERQTSFTQMMEIALNTAVSLGTVTK